jgi:polyisoprenoid-binding protein YceI
MATTNQSWTFDPAHSVIGFAVRHLMISKVRGTFDRWTGTFEYDDNNPGIARIAVRIEAASLYTRDAKRDAHLRSPDFFDVEKHPELRFVSTLVRGEGDGYVVAGDLTIRGITRPVDLVVERLGTARDPWGGIRAGFTAKTAINRKDFGLTWNQALETGGVLVGDKVEITLDIQAVRAVQQRLA